MLSDEKLKERISLLVRYFWIEDLFKIGKDLGVEYFLNLTSIWEANQYQAATRIAENISDAKLVELSKEYIPKYTLALGGFHGRFYTASTTGELELKSSWDAIRKNVRKALGKWGDRAYGTLQALINKGGKAAYFDLIDEIENVLGYDFIPSYLLPRLGPLGLVFRTGSNKYPEWTIPPEIVPVVEEEIHTFRRPSHPLHGQPSLTNRLLRQVREIDSLANRIVEARRNLNLLSRDKFGTVLFRQNEIATNDLRKPCSDEESFNSRILSLALLIDGIETESVSKLLRHEPKKGSVNLIEEFLTEYVPDFDKVKVKNLRMMVVLRSKRYPVHQDDSAYLNALNYFGFTDIPPDWQDLWATVLRIYSETLETFVSALRTFKQS